MRTHQRAGFTLIEILIVVLIIGILAAIAVPKFQNSKGKAYASTLKSDLRNLATAQEAYYYEKAEYANALTLVNIRQSPGVTMTITESSAAGWSATATHAAANPLTCAIFIGNAAAVTPASVEGIIACQ